MGLLHRDPQTSPTITTFHQKIKLVTSRQTHMARFSPQHHTSVLSKTNSSRMFPLCKNHTFQIWNLEEKRVAAHTMEGPGARGWGLKSLRAPI